MGVSRGARLSWLLQIGCMCVVGGAESGLCLQQAEGQGLAHSLLFAFYHVSSNNNNVEMQDTGQSQRQTGGQPGGRAKLNPPRRTLQAARAPLNPHVASLPPR